MSGDKAEAWSLKAAERGRTKAETDSVKDAGRDKALEEAAV